MGKDRASLGNLEGQGIVSLLRTAYKKSWSGVVRARSEGRSGALWLVRGQLTDCVMIEGSNRFEGLAALEDMAWWENITFMLDPDALPPARSIRLAMSDILDSLDRIHRHATSGVPETAAATPGLNLDELFESLRERVPGLEAIGVTQGSALKDTTMGKDADKSWLDRQLQAHFFDRSPDPEQLYLQDGDHTLLIVRQGPLAAVLMARSGTAPEALFWAGQEARKRME
jgi:hypothetical protein